MKKFLAVISLMLVLLSCSNDDTTSLDPIIGEWSILSVNGVASDNCTRQQPVTFAANGSYKIILYTTNTEGDCVVGNLNNGAWINKGNGKYEINLEGESPILSTIEFSSGNQIMTITREENGSVEVTKLERST